MKVCIIGAGGVLGRSLCTAFNRTGYKVTGIVWNTPQPKSLRVDNWFQCENSNLQLLLKVTRPWDVVVDLRAYTSKDLSGITEIAQNTAGHWIHVSTLYVYKRLKDAFYFNKEERFLPVPISEDTPCHPSGPYGIGKLECEKIWLDVHSKTELPVTILRLPFIYGPFDRSKRVVYYVKKLLKGQAIILPDSGSRFIDLLFSDDFSLVVVQLARNLECTGEIINISSKPVFPLKKHIEIIAELLGVKKIEIQCLDNQEIMFVNAPFAYPVDVVLDTSKLESILGKGTVTNLKKSWSCTMSWLTTLNQ